MISRISSSPSNVGNTFTFQRSITAFAGLLVAGSLFASVQANAAPVHFRYNGGHWSHAYHSGWNRYWGGPSVGFYYAPSPVYVVPGYSTASYYSGPNFWYSNPSFGLSINLGGGGYRSSDYYYSGGHYYTGGHYTGGRYVGGGHNFSGGRYYGGGHPSGGSVQRVQSFGGHSNFGGHGGRGFQDHHR